MKPTNTQQFLSDLNGGAFAEQIGVAVSNAARGVSHNGGKGKVIITLDLERVAQSNHVNIKHSLKSVSPTAKGRVTEEYSAETPMYVNSDSDVTALPKDQGQLFNKSGQKA